MKLLALTLVVLFGAVSGVFAATESQTAPAQTDEEVIAVEAVEPVEGEETPEAAAKSTN